MSDIALHRRLDAAQSRRKLQIRLAILALTPFLLLTGGAWDPGSWPRELMAGAGVGLVLVAILGRAWSTLYIGGRKARELVTSGPYSVTRNPLYLFSFVATAGLGAQTGSLTVTLVLLVTAYVIFADVVLAEEAALGKLHGVRFQTYRKSVPRFVPRLSLWTDARELTIDPGRWRQTVLDASLFLVLIPPLRGIGWVQLMLFGAPLLQLP